MKTQLQALVLAIAILCTSQPAFAGAAEDSLYKCQKALASETQKYISGYNKAVGDCLTKISSELIKNQAGSVAGAVNTCVSKLRLLKDSRMIGKSLEEKFRAKVGKVCDPSSPDVDHTWGDMYGIGNTVVPSMELRKSTAICGNFGVVFSNLSDFLACSIFVQKQQSFNTSIGVQFPGSLNNLSLLKDEILALAPSTDPTLHSDVIGAIDEVFTNLQYVVTQ